MYCIQNLVTLVSAVFGDTIARVEIDNFPLPLTDPRKFRRMKQIIWTLESCNHWISNNVNDGTPTVLQTDVASQCDKLVTDDGYQLITLTVHLSWPKRLT